MMSTEVVLDYGSRTLLGEGIFYDHEKGYLLWTDINVITTLPVVALFTPPTHDAPTIKVLNLVFGVRPAVTLGCAHAVEISHRCPSAAPSPRRRVLRGV